MNPAMKQRIDAMISVLYGGYGYAKALAHLKPTPYTAWLKTLMDEGMTLAEARYLLRGFAFFPEDPRKGKGPRARFKVRVFRRRVATLVAKRKAAAKRRLAEQHRIPALSARDRQSTLLALFGSMSRGAWPMPGDR